MVDIKDNRKYYIIVLIFSALIIAGLIILFEFFNLNIIALIFMFLLLEVIFVVHKTTNRITIDNKTIRIVYYKWLTKRERKFDISEIEIQTEDVIGLRGYKHKVLNIMIRGKKVYSIDTRNDFGNINIEKLNNQFNNKLEENGNR